MFSHGTNPSFFCVHPNCDKAFFNESDLTRHTKRNNSKYYQCLDCPYKDTDKRNYDSHRLSHSRIAKYKCEACRALCSILRKEGTSRMASAPSNILNCLYFNISCGNALYVNLSISCYRLVFILTVIENFQFVANVETNTWWK